MKIKCFTRIAAVAAVCGTLSLSQARAINETLLSELSKVPKAELPTQAAKRMAQATDEQGAAEIMGATLKLSPEAATTVVSEVAKQSPELAGVAAASAAALQPKLTSAIAKAAAGAAPEQAAKIVAAMCKKQPKAYSTIANAVAMVVANQDQAILAAMVEAIPALQPFYLRASEKLAPEGDPVVERYTQYLALDIEVSARELNLTEETLLTAGITPAQQTLLPAAPAPATPPIVRDPFQPLPGAPGEIDRNDTTVQDPSTYVRNYSVP